jgi:hypothetical protein
MHHSKLLLATCFWAAYLMAIHSKRIAALATATPVRSRRLQVGGLNCRKRRHSMVQPNCNALAGLVKVDETEIACRSTAPPRPVRLAGAQNAGDGLRVASQIWIRRKPRLS